MSVFGSIRVQVGRKGYIRRILSSGKPGRESLPDTGNPPKIVYCAHFLDNPGILSLSGGVCATPSL